MLAAAIVAVAGAVGQIGHMVELPALDRRPVGLLQRDHVGPLAIEDPGNRVEMALDRCPPHQGLMKALGTAMGHVERHHPKGVAGRRGQVGGREVPLRRTKGRPGVAPGRVADAEGRHRRQAARQRTAPQESLRPLLHGSPPWFSASRASTFWQPGGMPSRGAAVGRHVWDTWANTRLNPTLRVVRACHPVVRACHPVVRACHPVVRDIAHPAVIACHPAGLPPRRRL